MIFQPIHARYAVSGIFSICLAWLCGTSHSDAARLPESIVAKEGARVLWDFETSQDAWTLSKDIAELRALNGCLRGTATGNDPYVLDGSGRQLALQDVSGVTVKIWLSQEGPLQLYWENEDGGFSQVRSETRTLSGTSTRVRSLPDPQNDVWSAGAWNITAVSEKGVVTRSYYVDGLLKATVVFEKWDEEGDDPPDEAPADITAVADDGFISGSSATHDDYGRILTRTDSRTGTTNMGDYLDTGAVTSITEPGSRTTKYTYDKMGRTASVTLPDTTKTYTTYTARGEVEATWGSQTAGGGANVG